jgi:hypothetical protein
MSISNTNCDIKMAGVSHSEIVKMDMEISNKTDSVYDEHANNTADVRVKRNILLENNRKFISFGYWVLKKICSSSEIVQPESFNSLLNHLELFSDPTVQNDFVDNFNKDYSNFIKKEVTETIKLHHKEECNKQNKLNKISKTLETKQTEDTPVETESDKVKVKRVRKPKTVHTDTVAKTTQDDKEEVIGEEGKEIFHKLIEAVNGTDVKPKKEKRVYKKKTKAISTTSVLS